TLTVTLARPKRGLYLGAGLDHAGAVRVVDIGIPPDIIGAAKIPVTLLEAADIRSWLPVRPRTAHKGTFGHAGIIAGTAGKTGARHASGHPGVGPQSDRVGEPADSPRCRWHQRLCRPPGDARTRARTAGADAPSRRTGAPARRRHRGRATGPARRSVARGARAECLRGPQGRGLRRGGNGA